MTPSQSPSAAIWTGQQQRRLAKARSNVCTETIESAVVVTVPEVGARVSGKAAVLPNSPNKQNRFIQHQPVSCVSKESSRDTEVMGLQLCQSRSSVNLSRDTRQTLKRGAPPPPHKQTAARVTGKGGSTQVRVFPVDVAKNEEESGGSEKVRAYTLACGPVVGEPVSVML